MIFYVYFKDAVLQVKTARFTVDLRFFKILKLTKEVLG